MGPSVRHRVKKNVASGRLGSSNGGISPSRPWTSKVAPSELCNRVPGELIKAGAFEAGASRAAMLQVRPTLAMVNRITP